MAPAPLSPRVDLEQSKKQAKELLKAFRAGDPATLDRVRWNHPRFRALPDDQVRAGRFVLADAQLVVARLHYFESWPKLRAHIDTLARRDPAVLRFESAADAIVDGDLGALGALLADHPELVRERSTRAHHAPLLHFVSANGIEDYRQRTPPNVLDVARALLDAGADPNATSDAYGGSAALGLVATSTPPRRAGVQIALLDLLLERGATITPHIVRSALANDCPDAARALVERGASVDDVVDAAGIGRLDPVQRLAASAPKRDLERALVMAARYGTLAIVRWLLDQGVDIAASDGMTALHQATGRGALDIVRLLLERGAPLELENAHGGTALGNTLWFAYDADDAEFARRDFPAVIEVLLAAGARTDGYPEMWDHVTAVYRRAGRVPPARPA